MMKEESPKKISPWPGSAIRSSPSFSRPDPRGARSKHPLLEKRAIYKAIMNIKNAATDYPILQVLAERWSPYGFDDRPVPEADLCSLFEAARWAASSSNEQPWNYLVATKENPHEFGRLLSCLVEANQAWAKAAPVLVL